MPALKMKDKSGTASVKEVSCLHVTRKSSKMFKTSCSQVRLFSETAESDKSTQSCEIGSSDVEYSAMENGSNEDLCHKMLLDGESPPVQKSKDPLSPKRMDLPPSACQTNTETIFSPDINSSGIHLKSSSQDGGGCEDGPAVPEVIADDYDGWSSMSSSDHASHTSNSYISDMSVPLSIYGIAGFEDILNVLVPKETCDRKHVTLVLDLDETLVHSTMVPCDNVDFTFQVLFDTKEHTVYVRQRPFLRTFLERVAQMFEIVVFTASQSIYAERLLDILDPDSRLITRRLYRESCIFSDGSYTKDLTVLGVDLAKIAIIDNSPQVFRLQVNNGIPIESWFDDPSDSALISLIPFLEILADADDVRPIIANEFGVTE